MIPDEFTKPIFDVRQKILITDLVVESTPSSWWLRSVYNFIYYGDSDSYHYLGYVHFTSHISQIFPDYSFGISPACTI